MRICLLTRYFDYRNAGIGRVSCEIRDRLIARGHDVVPISTNRESLTSYFKYVSWDIRRAIPRDCDVYHAITPMEGMWLPRSKSVTTYLDLIPMTHPDRAGAGIGYSRIKNMIGRNCFGIGARMSARNRILVAISNTTRRHMSNVLGASDVEVIQLGIRDDLEPAEKVDGVFRIGYLGQLDRRKRVNLLIEAFRKSKIDGELVIAGTGRDEDILRQLAGDDKRIKFLGFVPDSELCDFYNSLDVFAFPTWIEGYGLPIVEAFACKKPVIVWGDAEIPEEVMDRCHRYDDDLTLGRCNGDISIDDNYRFAKKHSWDKCVEEYENIYRRLLV